MVHHTKKHVTKCENRGCHSFHTTGLNAPIPPGASFGYHPGGWGKPPVDEVCWILDPPTTVVSASQVRLRRAFQDVGSFFLTGCCVSRATCWHVLAPGGSATPSHLRVTLSEKMVRIERGCCPPRQQGVARPPMDHALRSMPHQCRALYPPPAAHQFGMPLYGDVFGTDKKDDVCPPRSQPRQE